MANLWDGRSETEMVEMLVLFLVVEKGRKTAEQTVAQKGVAVVETMVILPVA